jgi:hypothetical protein
MFDHVLLAWVCSIAIDCSAGTEWQERPLQAGSFCGAVLAQNTKSESSWRREWKAEKSRWLATWLRIYDSQCRGPIRWCAANEDHVS